MAQRATRTLTDGEVDALLAGEPGAREIGMYIDNGFVNRWFPTLGEEVVGKHGEERHYATPEEATAVARRVKEAALAARAARGLTT